ncbi:putative methyltransferase domain-containing protein [Botrytis fragariae]|uniref:Putative methyltransferase domain-containing protein n=1 Tax=Botrytis fragariae TaxID=1964551 RepID=A0A8H6AQI3_9HELO|nr:putative methyltransferase domain-containing protein [Botrytis fragariae]KAF5871520.1 putative methyltransferase domain-containing protein [Botrytis fragariae]
MANGNNADIEVKIEERSTNLPWYQLTIPSTKLDGAIRELLEDYAGIPLSEVEPHVYNIRKRAWSIFPYPCIGAFQFLDIVITSSPYYPTLLSRLASPGTKFLDLGCCFGQVIRRLVYDGALPENLYGCDLRAEFFELGYDLFKDKDNLKSTLFKADIFDEDNVDMKRLEGDIDVIYAGSFLHLYGWDDQVKICKILARAMKKEGSVLMGRQGGGKFAKEVTFPLHEENKMFVHNAESFRKMWDEVSETTGTKWKVECKEVQLRSDDWKGAEGMVWVQFIIFRE